MGEIDRAGQEGRKWGRMGSEVGETRRDLPRGTGVVSTFFFVPTSGAAQTIDIAR